MTAALDRATAALGNANVKAFLHVIREGESSHDETAYTVVNGGTHFPAPPWHHPYHGIPTTQGARASGAYQFLGTTWERCAEALGLGEDFGPVAQDLGAVYLIEGRGALAAVQAGDLVLACSKLSQEWVSLPGLGLARVQRVFVEYGGTAQDRAGATISPEPIPTYPDAVERAPASGNALQQPERPMFAMLLPALLQLIPQLAPVFGAKGEKVDQMSQIAQAVTGVITTLTSAGNLQGGIEKMQADPAVKAQVSAAVLAAPPVAAVLESMEAGGGGIGGARKAAMDATAPEFYKTAPFWVALLLLVVVYAVVYSVLFQPATAWRPEDRSQILMLAVAISSGVMGYFLGSSIGSARKNDIIAEQQR